MCRFVETIRILNRLPLNLAWHQLRYERTARHFFGTAFRVENLCNVVEKIECGNGTYKVRVVYGRCGIEEVSCEPYSMKPVESLRLVCCDGIDYSFKSTDRRVLDVAVAQKDGCDNVVIVRNGLLTDTSYTNIALYDGSKWYTPQKPLLHGTTLMRLLSEGKLESRDIRAADVWGYRQVALFNAMVDFGAIVLPVEAVRS